MFSQISTICLLIAGISAADPVGVPARIEEYPSQVQVEFLEEGGWVKRCSASIISELHLVTTAGCFHDRDLTNSRIRASSTTLGSGGKLLLLEEVTPHPGFHPGTYEDDIAVLKLKKPLVFSERINKTILLPDGVFPVARLGNSVAGWGATIKGSEVSSNDLYSIVLIMNSPARKTFTLGKSFNGGGRDFDFSDRGSPVFLEGSNNWMHGILSYGIPDGDHQYPIVATFIGAYYRWIMATAEILVK